MRASAAAALIALAAVLSQSVTAAPDTTPARGAPLRFGLSSAGLSYPFAAAIAQGFQQQAARTGVEAVVLDAQGSVQKQANDLDDLLSQRVAGIVLMPLDGVIAQSWVDRAAAAGIPVVAVGSQVGDPNTRPLHEVYPGLTALVTQDEVLAGQEAGRLALTLLPRDRVARIAVIEGAPGFPEVLQRAEGFRQALDAVHARYRIVASQPGNWTADDADTACQNILAAHPDVDLFFNEADDMAVGCARAVRSAGSHARLVGIGGSRLAIVSLEAGRIDGTVCYEPRELGTLAFDALYEDVTGRKPLHAAFITYRTPGITRANVGACPAQW
ncbi:MAG TPA: sugar ABC transporter substrate-binding protein [Steroidobacteraceae bacterium]|nr:sugar ABC transporter substrate-binding protein [Steroidobacteraceae bacterium]